MMRKAVKMGIITSLILGTFSIGEINCIDLKHESSEISQIKDQVDSSLFVVNSQGSLIKYNGNEKEVILPPTVKSISFGAFLDKSEIKKVVLPEQLKQIDEYAFYSCTSLEEIVIPDSVESIGRLAFGNCLNCKKVYLGKNLKEIGEFAFGICESLSEVEVNCLNENYSSKDGILYDKDQKILKLCPPQISGVLNIPDTVETIGEYAFTACKKLKEVNRPNGKMLKVEDAAFYGCESLTNLDIKGGLEKIGSFAFAECTSLKEFKVDETVKSIGSSVFMKCASLNKVSFLSKDTVLGRDLFVSCPQVIIIDAGQNSNAKEYVEKHSSKLAMA